MNLNMSGKKGRKCSMLHCTSYQHTHKHLSFFRFPKDPERCKMWIDKSGRPELAGKTAVYEDRVCEKHFEPSMFLNDYRNRLHTTAVPVLLLDPVPPPLPVVRRPVPKLKIMLTPPKMSPTMEPNSKRIKIDHSDDLLEEMAPPHHQPTPPQRKPAVRVNAPQQIYLDAANDIRTTGLSFRKAADKYNINYVTLRRFCGRLAKSMEGIASTAMPFTASPFQVTSSAQYQHQPQLKQLKHSQQPQLRHPQLQYSQLQQQHTQLQNQFQLELKQQQKQLQQHLLQQQQAMMKKQLKQSQQKQTRQQQQQQRQQNNHVSPPQQYQKQPPPLAMSASTSLSTPAAMATAAPPTMTKRPRQIFSIEQEDELAIFVRDTSNYYNGMSSKDVRTLAFVYGICNQVDLPAGWRETHMASFDWCLGFIKRNKLTPAMTTNNSVKNGPSSKNHTSVKANDVVNNSKADDGVVATTDVPITEVAC